MHVRDEKFTDVFNRDREGIAWKTFVQMEGVLKCILRCKTCGSGVDSAGSRKGNPCTGLERP